LKRNAVFTQYVLARRGWSRTALTAGEKLTVEFWPLRDGRNGGHLKTATRADGSVLQAAGGPRGVDGVDKPFAPSPVKP
jgi:hypothetical protein